MSETLALLTLRYALGYYWDMHATKTTLIAKLRWGLLGPGERVLAAVSGGPDSLSLLHALWTEGTAHGLGTVEAAHLDHGLRGEESAAEARWVAEWCAEREIACHVGFADVARLARERKITTQEAARLARYAFLEKTAEARGADKIATGHTRDDQVETVLGNILRGTGLDGLRGIPERRGRIVRPLLDVSRPEIEAYCVAHGLTPRQDPSNLETDHYTRNRIRLELLPQIRKDYNQQTDRALLRLSLIAARDSDYLTLQAQSALSEATFFFSPTRLALDVLSLRALHPALLRYILRLAVAQIRGTEDGITYASIERLCEIISCMTEPAGGVHVEALFPQPGCRISVFPTVLRIEPKQVLPKYSDQMPVPLSVPGKATLAGGWMVQAAWEDHPGAERLNADAIDISSLVVRNWRSGDRIDPFGMGGHHKKVSDIFTGAKVPRSERHTVPIVADALGIVWIVGHTVAERARVTDGTQRRLFLSASRQEQETG